MENQPPAKRRKEAAGSMDEDRISQLPLPILQNQILSLLPQNDAVRTCVLSKSWRHLGSTLPKFEFDEYSFSGGKDKFISAVNDTLQRYVDQKLTIQEFVLRIMLPEETQESNDSISLLIKWIPIVIMNMGVKKFKLTTKEIKGYFPLPSVVKQAVFQAEFLAELDLRCCKLNQINCIIKPQVLKRLMLWCVSIEDETFEKILSSCPLIEHLVLFCCNGLSTARVNKARNLKHLRFTNSGSFFRDESFEISDSPSLETINISSTGSCFLFHLHSNFIFPRLKSLTLRSVRLTTELLNNLSLNCPYIEVLELHCCLGLTKLSNHSIRRLFISTSEHAFKAAIDVPNMLDFEFRNTYLPSSISFATTSREWKSLIHVGGHWDPYGESESRYHLNPNHSVSSPWPLKLNKFLKALSQSRISMNIYNLPLENEDTCVGGGGCDPVVVEHLSLKALYSSEEIPVLLNSLFRICRPRYIELSLPTYFPHSILNVTQENMNIYESQLKIYERQLAESIWKILVNKGGTRECDFWNQDLEGSSIQVSYKNTSTWHPVQAVCELSNNQTIRFGLKWRDFS